MWEELRHYTIGWDCDNPTRSETEGHCWYALPPITQDTSIPLPLMPPTRCLFLLWCRRRAQNLCCRSLLSIAAPLASNGSNCCATMWQCPKWCCKQCNFLKMEIWPLLCRLQHSIISTSPLPIRAQPMPTVCSWPLRQPRARPVSLPPAHTILSPYRQGTLCKLFSPFAPAIL